MSGEGKRSRKELREGGAAEVPAGRVPRVAKLMALAIRFDQLIRDGVVADQAELARLGHVSPSKAHADHELAELGTGHSRGNFAPAPRRVGQRPGDRARSKADHGRG